MHACDEAEDEHGLRGHERKVDRGADRDEKQPEQQTFERIDIALELVAVLARREHDAGQERAQRGREPHAAHEQRDADDQQERGGREDLAQPRAGDRAEQRSHEESPAHHDRSHRTEDDKRAGPRRQSGHERRVGVLRVTGHGVRCQQREHREHRDHRDVLEQEHGKRALPASRLEQALLAERLQHDGGRRHREREANRERRLPPEPRRHRGTAKRDGRSGDLEGAQPEDRPSQPPQEGRLELEADDEQHHDDAELGEVHDVLPVSAEQPEAEGSDRDAREQVPEHRAEAPPRGERHGGDRRREVDERLEQEVAAHASVPGPNAASASLSVAAPATLARSSASPCRRRSTDS